MSGPSEGAPAPDFELAGADGPIRLADFKGKTLVLYFYPKDDTPGCTNEAKDFSALSAEFAKAGASICVVYAASAGPLSIASLATLASERASAAHACTKVGSRSTALR